MQSTIGMHLFHGFGQKIAQSAGMEITPSKYISMWTLATFYDETKNFMIGMAYWQHQSIIIIYWNIRMDHIKNELRKHS